MNEWPGPDPTGPCSLETREHVDQRQPRTREYRPRRASDHRRRALRVQCAEESIPDDVAILTLTATKPYEDTHGLTAGLDLEWAQDLAPHDGYDLLKSFYDMIQTVRDLDAVTVCGCGDYTLGVGFELAAACEFRVATADATLGLPEIDIGLPSVIHSGLLLRLTGEGIANELIYAGKLISGERAAELGIITTAAKKSQYNAELSALVVH